GPDEDIEDRYLYELNSRRRELDLEEIEDEEAMLANGSIQLEEDPDDVVIVTPGRGGRAGSRRVGNNGSNGPRTRQRDEVDIDLTEFDPDGDSGTVRGDSGTVSEVDFSDGGINTDRGRRPARTSRSDRSKKQGANFVDTSTDIQDADEFADELARLGEVEQDEPDLAYGLLEDDPDEVVDFIDDDSFAEYIPRRRGAVREPIEGAPENRRRDGRPASDQSTNTKPEEAVVRSLDSMRAKPRTLTPESFADAKLVADEFKRDIPVLLNLQGLERDLARRLIDFASGICYALDGSMEKIASQVFLLIPESVEVSDEDRRRIEERGYAR
ncbi:MAG: cell division protein SepF, partial [Acidimicrobiales bacterium]